MTKTTKLVKFGDYKVTPRAKKMLKKAYAMKELGLPCVAIWEQDDSEYDTLETMVRYADEMSAHVLCLRNHGISEAVTPDNLGSFTSGRYIFVGD